MKNIILGIAGVIIIALVGLAFWTWQQTKVLEQPVVTVATIQNNSIPEPVVQTPIAVVTRTQVSEIAPVSQAVKTVSVPPIASKATSFICGTSTVADADNNIYNTVKIGTQCWMASNLKVGTRIIGTQESLNNSITEKYCYDDININCTTDGGLYQWDEAMNYSTTEGAQGICPASWNIPSDAQQYILENFLKDTGQTCDASRNGQGCSTAGIKLKSGGSSGFNSILVGTRDVSGWFQDRTLHAGFWSSSRSGDSSVWWRYLSSGDTTVFREPDSRFFGFSVRCLKN